MPNLEQDWDTQSNALRSDEGAFAEASPKGKNPRAARLHHFIKTP